jgi:hypothetical protein
VAVAVAAAAAAVGAAAAAAVAPESARAGPLAALARFSRSLAQAVILLFSLSLSLTRASPALGVPLVSSSPAALGSRARRDGRVRDVIWWPAGEVEALLPRVRLKHYSTPAACSNAR